MTPARQEWQFTGSKDNGRPWKTSSLLFLQVSSSALVLSDNTMVVFKVIRRKTPFGSYNINTSEVLINKLRGKCFVTPRVFLGGGRPNPANTCVSFFVLDSNRKGFVAATAAHPERKREPQ